MNAPSESFDVEDRDRTQRVTIPLAGVNKDDEIAGLQLTVGRLKAQREQLRVVLGLERDEIIRQKATVRGVEKKCSIYEAMIADLLMQLEGERP